MANPRQGLRTRDRQLEWMTSITCGHMHMLESHAGHTQFQGHSQGHFISFAELTQHLITNKHTNICIIHAYQLMYTNIVRLVGPIKNGIYAVT